MPTLLGTKSARLLLVLLLCLIAFGQASYDVILSGGKIVDGTGNAWFCGDVALSGVGAPAWNSGAWKDSRVILS